MKRHAPEEARAELPLFDFAAQQARNRAELGAMRAAAKADRKEPGWQHAALAALRTFATRHETFLLEEARAAIGTPVGADPRAWGSIARKAEKLGYMRKDGYELAVKSNCCAKPKWKSLVFEAGVTSR